MSCGKPGLVPFFTQTAKPVGGDGGSIAEGYFIVQDGKVFLCDADGTPSGDGYPPRPEPAPRPIRRKRRRGAW